MFLLEPGLQQVTVKAEIPDQYMQTILRLSLVFAAAGLLIGCGQSGSVSETKMPDPATQPEANAAVFQRTCDGVNALIERKDYKTASEAIESFKKFKLTPEQEKIVEQMRARIPKSN
ncbi:MAG TPA: hypothetical protein VFZ59_25600 [Verrucomicrobiae bacterium]|nr:hypothetical protein [Verrucomicrobiae bacterium]